MEFSFDLEEQYMQTLDINDPGNTSLCCRDEAGNEYYIATKTVMGKTSVLKAGPVCPDIMSLTNNFSCFYKKFDYSEKTLFKEINLFINDNKKKIIMIEELQLEELLQLIPNVTELFMTE